MRYREYKKVDLPWLDEVPRHWEIKRSKFYIHSKKEINKDKKVMNVLSLTLNGVIRNDAENPIGLSPSDYSTYQIFNNNDLVFKLIDLDNVRTSRVGLVNELGIMSSAYIRGIINNNILFPKYIYYWYYKLYIEEVYNKLGSGVRSTISSSELLEMQIPIPPKEEQEQIASFLDWKINEIDRLMEIEVEKIKVIKKSIKSVHQDLILGKLKNKSMNFTNKKFVDGIPSNWKVVKLKKVLEKIEIDANKDDEIVICSNHGYSFFRGDRKIGLSSEDNRYYQRVKKNQIMIHGMDTWHGAICISNHYGKCTRVVHVCKSQENDEYIVYYLRLLAFIGMYKPYSNGVRQNTSDFRSWNVLGNIDILLPPKEEQDSIALALNKYIKTSNKIIKISEGRIKKLQLLKQSIISDLVTGKVDIRNIEIPNFERFENDNLQEESEESLESIMEEV